MTFTSLGFVLLVVTAVGCSSSSSGGGAAPVAGPASATIGADGGTLTGADGVSLDVPPGALAAGTMITVVPATGLAVLPNGVTPAGGAYSFSPDGLMFLKPVTVHVPATAASASLYVLAGGATSWTLVPGASVAGGFVTASILHFSSYQAGSAGSVPVSKACSDCASSACGGQVKACTSEPTCNACITKDASAASCAASGAWQTLSACACQPTSCGAACSPECGGTGAAGASGAGGSGAGGSGAGGSGAGGSAGSGTAGASGSGAGGATGGPVSSACSSCAQSGCGAQVNACISDPTCGACIKSNYAAASCKTNAAWAALSTCACAAGGCMAACASECAP